MHNINFSVELLKVGCRSREREREVLPFLTSGFVVRGVLFLPAKTMLEQVACGYLCFFFYPS
jgi:hypothetical protein